MNKCQFCEYDFTDKDKETINGVDFCPRCGLEMVDPTRIDADWSKGIPQCQSRLSHGRDGYLNCRFVNGHSGKHKTCYTDGTEWDDNEFCNFLPSYLKHTPYQPCTRDKNHDGPCAHPVDMRTK